MNSNDLPNGWIWTKLENCIEVLDSQRIPINADEREKRIAGKSTSELYPYYGATGQVGWIEDYLFDEELILLGEDGAPFFEQAKNKAYIIKGKSWVNNHAHVLKAIAGVTLNQFICNYLNRFDYHGYVTGTTRAKLNQSPMRKIPITLPPLPEQRRIVTKIEELFTKLDAGVEALKKTQAQLKRYRSSVLKAACEGKLVPTEAELAKVEGRDYEPADVLLARILKERREKWNGKGKYKKPDAPDTNGLSQLPEGWCWVRLDSLAALKGGITKDQNRKVADARKIPYLRVANVQRGYLDLSEIKEIEAQESVISELLLKPGDILFNEGGDRDKLGRGCIWNGEIEECIYQNHIFRARIYSNDISNKIISWFGNTFGQRYFMKEGKQTTNLASINLTKLSAFPVPLPPLAEQRRIVAEVERRLSVADGVERTVEQNLGKAQRLRQSILKKAFEGRLVAQDASDEPAGVLLERIKAEKAQTGETKRKR